MRWEDEQYVRLYTRDTTEWVALDWRSRAVFYELIRKVDRAGIIEVGRTGLKGLAGLLRMPLDVVEFGLPELLADGSVRAIDGGFLVPNFIEAQEVKQSDRARKAASRARARDSVRERSHDVHGAAGGGHPVTSCDQNGRGVTDTGQSVTKRDALSKTGPKTGQEVTCGHTESHAVTDGHSELSLAEQSLAEVPDGKPKSMSDQILAELERSPKTRGLATKSWADDLMLLAGTVRPDAVIASIRKCVVGAQDGMTEQALKQRITSFVGNAKRYELAAPPREQPAEQTYSQIDDPALKESARRAKRELHGL